MRTIFLYHVSSCWETSVAAGANTTLQNEIPAHLEAREYFKMLLSPLFHNSRALNYLVRSTNFVPKT